MKDAYYFPHDSNARNDQRLIKVRMKYGMEGYGIYFGIIEIMREQEDYIISESDIESVAYDLRVEKDMIKDLLYNHRLFEIRRDAVRKEAFFFSKSLKRRMEKLDLIKEKRAEAGRLGGKSGSKSKASAKAKVKHLEASKVDKSIVDKSKVNKNTVNNIKINIPFEDFWNLYDYKVGNKIKTQKNWESLKDEERLAIIKHLPLYVNSTPDKQFRKHPLTYLNNRGWEDEIVSLSNGVKKSHNFEMPDGKFYLAFCDKCLKSDFYETYEFDPDNIDSKCCNSKIIDKFERDKRKQAMLNN